ERLWEDEPPANSGNALQSLVSRLRTALRQGGLGDQVIESHPAGYRLALAPDRIDAVAFEAQARDGGQALASGDPGAARPAPAAGRRSPMFPPPGSRPGPPPGSRSCAPAPRWTWSRRALRWAKATA